MNLFGCKNMLFFMALKKKIKCNVGLLPQLMSWIFKSSLTGLIYDFTLLSFSKYCKSGVFHSFICTLNLNASLSFAVEEAFLGNDALSVHSDSP